MIDQRNLATARVGDLRKKPPRPVQQHSSTPASKLQVCATVYRFSRQVYEELISKSRQHALFKAELFSAGIAAERLTETRLTYIAEREGDIDDLFVEAPCPEYGADWLVRVQHHDRLLADQGNLREALDAAPVLTEIAFDRPASNGRPARTVEQQIKVVRVTLKAPSRPDRTLPDVTVTALLATEAHLPAGEDPLDWLLLTNLSVETTEQAIEKLQVSVCRWQIEISFKVLKSSCRIEALQLEKRERLEPALAFDMIIARRVLHLSMLGRACPEMPCNRVFSDEAWQALYLATQRQPPPDEPPSLDTMVSMVATLGGQGKRI
jgi:hypothetical protein